MSFRCTVRGPGGDTVTFPVRDGHLVLREMLLRPGRDISVGCRGGGCGVCRVQVLSGDYLTRRMSRAHVTEAEQAAGIVLACRLIPLTDIIVEPRPSKQQPQPTTAGSTAP